MAMTHCTDLLTRARRRDWKTCHCGDSDSRDVPPPLNLRRSPVNPAVPGCDPDEGSTTTRSAANKCYLWDVVSRDANNRLASSGRVWSQIKNLTCVKLRDDSFPPPTRSNTSIMIIKRKDARRQPLTRPRHRLQLDHADLRLD